MICLSDGLGNTSRKWSFQILKVESGCCLVRVKVSVVQTVRETVSITRQVMTQNPSTKCNITRKGFNSVHVAAWIKALKIFKTTMAR